MNANIICTQEFYRSITAKDLCGCGYCRNYYRQIKKAYPEAAAYLAALGADIEKPLETSPLEPDDAGMLEYCGCQYIICGNCPEDFRHSIGGIDFRVTTSHPRICLEDVHFVLELFPVRLPWQSES